MERKKMSREMRAKQFMPFAAMKGYEEALAAKEHIVIEKSELSEDQAALLDEILLDLKTNDMISVVYYEKDAYVKATGVLAKIDLSAKYLQVVQKKISFEDVYSIETL